jgi:hypothetical protein
MLAESRPGPLACLRFPVGLSQNRLPKLTLHVENGEQNRPVTVNAFIELLPLDEPCA